MYTYSIIKLYIIHTGHEIMVSNDVDSEQKRDLHYTKKKKLHKTSIILKIFKMIVKNHRLNFKKKTKR